MEKAGETRQEVVFFVRGGAEPRTVRFVEETLGIPALGGLAEPPEDRLTLRADGDGLCLVKNGRCLRGDFAPLLPRTAAKELNRELLVRAARRKGGGAPTAVDATAGLGEDAFLLAAAGFRVALYERDRVIAALLYDALGRGGQNPALAPILARMTFHFGDSVSALPTLTPPPDVVLLDPMFPPRRKSALVKKKFQLLHHLERPCPDEEALLDAALACRPGKIIVKRPAKGPYLAGHKPSYTLRGSTVRYDCILPAPRGGEKGCNSPDGDVK